MWIMPVSFQSMLFPWGCASRRSNNTMQPLNAKSGPRARCDFLTSVLARLASSVASTSMKLLPATIPGVPQPARVSDHLKRGRPTGATVPLLWAHAEYIKLLRSVRDGRVFDLIPEVADRYIQNRSALQNVQVWSIQHPSGSVQRGRTFAHCPTCAWMVGSIVTSDRSLRSCLAFPA